MDVDAKYLMISLIPASAVGSTSLKLKGGGVLGLLSTEVNLQGLKEQVWETRKDFKVELAEKWGITRTAIRFLFTWFRGAQITRGIFFFSLLFFWVMPNFLKLPHQCIIYIFIQRRRKHFWSSVSSFLAPFPPCFPSLPPSLFIFSLQSFSLDIFLIVIILSKAST